MTDSVSESESPAIASPTATVARPRTNQDWWPNQLDLSVLHRNSPLSDPLGEDFDYAKEFSTLDLEALRRDLIELMGTSQEWWPSDYGHYGPLFIRMSWHAAGTYRIADGRGGGGHGAQRFAPLNSWPDNASLDKARRLLWPIKQKYGRKISWADLLVYTGNVAMESMGFQTFGFGFGREDIWEPEEIFWGPEDTWLGDERYSGNRQLAKPLGAVQMGLIYVNPEGPNGNPDPVAAAVDIRETFARMAMNDEETVALIVGGHTFGKTHGAARPEHCRAGAGGRLPRGAGTRLEGQPAPQRRRRAHAHRRAGGSLDERAHEVEQRLPRQPLQIRLGADGEPGRRQAVDPEGPRARRPRAGRPRPLETVPGDDADDGSGAEVRPPLRADRKALLREPRRARGGLRQGLVQAAPPRHGAALALPRPVDPGGPAVAGPGPRRRARADRRRGRRRAEGEDPRLGPLVPRLIATAWSAASSFRGTDNRGGANGARIRLAPQKDWEANEPAELAAALATLEQLQRDFNEAQSGGKRVSLADVIVLGGCAAVEAAAKAAGHEVTVPFTPGRTDASQEQTDVDSFAVLEPTVDGFRNYFRGGEPFPLEHGLLDRAFMLNLTAPEMTVLIGGMRALNANFGGSAHGVFTDRPEQLTNDFFVNLLDMATEWKASGSAEQPLRGPRPKDRRDQVDRHLRRPGLRLQLRAAGARRGLRERRRAGEVRA